jgi:outer membrane protein insertion porin family
LNRYGGTVELVHRLSRHVDGSVSYLFERVKLEEASISKEDLSQQGLDLLYNKSSITVGFISDWSSPVFSPTSCLWASTSIQASGLGLGSEYHFYKALLEVRHYQRLGGFVLSSRAKWGGIKSMDDDSFVPVEERLFSGGSRSVRGWPRAELGPIVDGVPVGGKALLEGAVELRHRLFWKISGAVFVDAGNVWKDNSDISLNEIRYSAGTGLRYGTPIGPIRIDFARPVDDERTSWLIHLSVGQAF